MVTKLLCTNTQKQYLKQIKVLQTRKIGLLHRAYPDFKNPNYSDSDP